MKGKGVVFGIQKRIVVVGGKSPELHQPRYTL